MQQGVLEVLGDVLAVRDEHDHLRVRRVFDVEQVEGSCERAAQVGALRDQRCLVLRARDQLRERLEVECERRALERLARERNEPDAVATQVREHLREPGRSGLGARWREVVCRHRPRDVERHGHVDAEAGELTLLGTPLRARHREGREDERGEQQREL